VRRTRLALALAALGAWPCAGMAQNAIVSDGRMPTPTAVSSVGDAYTIGGGTVRGTNLFHSFTRFNVPTGGSAIFDGPPTTENVISRVTGLNEVSNIDGLISTRGGASPMPLANFYLINPNGIMFGPNAMLDVGGAFHASTADYIRLADGTVFAAAPVPGEVLTSAPPQAFGFLSSNPAPISVDGSQLFVDPGQTLSLVGGDIQLTNGAVLAALGGVVQLASVASPGEVVLGAPDLNLSSFARLGEVNISGFSGITTDGDFGLPNGTILIRSGRLVMDGATLLNQTYDTAGAATGIDINARESVALSNSALIQTVAADSASASGISITTGSLSLSDLSSIESLGTIGKPGQIDIHVASADIASGAGIRTNSNSSGSDINLAASGTVTLSGAFSDIFTTTRTTDSSGTIFAGDIAIQARSVVLTEGAKVHTGDATSQSGRNVIVTLSDSLTVSSLAGIESFGFSGNGANVVVSAPRVAMDGGFISTSMRGTGRAGQVVVDALSVNLSNGAQIATSSARTAGGTAGSMTINASGAVVISGAAAGIGLGDVTGSRSPSSGLFSTAAGTGNAGQILVATPSLSIADGGKISVAASFTGNAGTITANASNIALNSGGQITSSTTASGAGGAITLNSSSVGITGANSGLFSTAGGGGNAGQILVSAPSLTVADSGKISVATSAAGSAGTITANVTNVALNNGGQITSSTAGGGAGGAITLNSSSVGITGTNTGLFSTAGGAGNAGQILVAAPSLTVTDGGRISASTSAAGNAGTIAANAANVVLNAGQITSSTTGGGSGGAINLNSTTVGITGTNSGLFSTASSTGNAGTITVASSNLNLGAGGKISASTIGAGRAGTIIANVGTLNLASGGSIESSTSGAGAGGSISLNLGALAMAGAGAALSSTAAGSGNAGQITISGSSANVADGARISVTTSGTGNAGTITANVGSMTISGGQLDSSTSARGNGGAINVSAGTDVSVLNGGRITGDSVGSGLTGNINVAAGNRITMTGGSISTRSLTSDGGNITLKAPQVVRIENSQITTSVQSGTGAGGNIMIDPQFLLTNNSAITANAFGGPGGNITIIADNFLPSATTLIQASSALSTPGTIQISSPENNLASSIAQLPRAFVDASRLMRGSCSARREGAPSSFMLAGRGGVPADADGYLPSYIGSGTAAPLAFARLDYGACAY